MGTDCRKYERALISLALNLRESIKRVLLITVSNECYVVKAESCLEIAPKSEILVL